MKEEELQRGITDIATRLAKWGIKIKEQQRPWPNRFATYFEIGVPDRYANVVLPDEFLCDLPQTREYQTAVDLYAAALAGRIRWTSPTVFYCLSNLTIDVEVEWPIHSGVANNAFFSVLLVTVRNLESGAIAKCCVDIGRQFAYSGRTIFDDLRNAINNIRRGIDDGMVSFYDSRSHPGTYQRVSNEARVPAPMSKTEIEKFTAGKTYALAFHVPEEPTQAWIADPWDAEYLSVPTKELSQSAHTLHARGLIELDSRLSSARPIGKLLIEGLSALDAIEDGSLSIQAFEISKLPKKEALLTELEKTLGRGAGIAVVVIDLDKFKEVNDTKGHTEGDKCLERVVKAIGDVLGRKGRLFRWGGDEFAISLPDFSTQEALVTAERIRKAIEEAKAGGDVAVTASVGVCANDQLQNAKAEPLLNSADEAMYASKKNGKNRVTSWPIS